MKTRLTAKPKLRREDIVLPSDDYPGMRIGPFTLLAAGAIAALLATGCSNNKGGSDQTTTSTTTTTTSSTAPDSQAASPASTTSSSTTTTTTTTSSSAQGDPAKGKQIFAANCASCHGATGTEGGVGPSLKNEKSRKNYDQTVAWIKNPQPPMPKLFPNPLTEADVDNVAAYVQTL